MPFVSGSPVRWTTPVEDGAGQWRRGFGAPGTTSTVDSHEVRRAWAERTGEYSPEYYAYYGANGASDAVLRRLDRFVGRDAKVLELGCGSGRHLAHLVDNGFESITGIDLNPDAFEVMRDHYPELVETGTFVQGAIEDVVERFETQEFDAVYSVETLQHVHPDAAWVFPELARITGDLLVTIEHEGGRNGQVPPGAEGGSTIGAGGEESADRGREEGAARGRTDGHGRDGDGAPDENRERSSSHHGTGYVTETIPIYYRDWGRIFTNAGMDQVGVEPGRRDTIRTFRTAATGGAP